MNENPNILHNLRLVLWVMAVGLIFACIQTWQMDFAPAPTPADTQPASPSATVPPPAPSSLPQIPDQPAAAAAAPSPATTAQAAPSSVPPAGEVIHVRTDVLDVEINTVGGDLQHVRLPNYPVHKDQPDVPVELLSPAPDQLFLFHTGLRAPAGQPEANHLAPMS